jgi:hypothetical protein
VRHKFITIFLERLYVMEIMRNNYPVYIGDIKGKKDNLIKHLINIYNNSPYILTLESEQLEQKILLDLHNIDQMSKNKRN